MSNSKLKSTLNVFALACLGVAAGFGGMKYYDAKSPLVRRSIASTEEYKPSRLMLGKQAAAMSVEIVGPAEPPDSANEITELAGFITQHIAGDSWLDYKWTLPKGVELVQGQTNGSFEALTLGQPRRVTILVKALEAA
ncbi:MAG: hypothetical protein EOP04_22820 [Proteobacteria bacterium]|nr:MAG: hypothetical protein EOP04_22820 [Pseudomonadota bacterium]